MTRRLSALPAILALSLAPTVASDPDSVLDPETGYIEIVSSWWNGSDHDIRLTTDRGTQLPESTTLFDGPTEDIAPRIALTSAGTLWVVWSHDATTDQILLRGRGHGTWGDVLPVTGPTESGHDPRILADGHDTLVAFTVQEAFTQEVVLLSIQDEPDPIGPRHIVATTTWSGDLDVQLHVASGHTWVTWIDDDEVGWSALSSGTWGSPEYEGIVDGDVKDAREAIYATVLGL